MVPVIQAANPITEPPIVIPEKNFDKLWVSTIVISSFDPNKDSSAEVEFNYYNLNNDGTKEIRPNSSFHLKLTGLFERAATDPVLAKLMDDLVSFIIAVAKEQGIVKQD